MFENLWVKSALFRVRGKIAATYGWLAFQTGVLPLPSRVKRYSEYRSQSAAFNHYDFWPTQTDDAKLHAIWVVDFITPSQLSVSVKKMKRVRWDKTLLANADPNEWMESTRNVNSGGWRNLGTAAPMGTKWFGSITRFRRFPKSFDYATFQVLTVTPSLSAIVGCFHLKNDRISRYMEILKEHHFPYGKPDLSGAITIMEPRSIKRELLYQERKALRAEIVEFMELRFGGFFSTFQPEKIPTIETLELSDNPSEDFTRFLFDDFDMWSSRLSGLRWAHAREAPSGHSVLTFQRATLDEIDLRMNGGKNASSLISRLSHSLPSNWTFEALHHLLGAYDKIVSRLRDSEFTPITNISRRTSLLNAERSWEMADIHLVTAEVERRNFRWLHSNMLQFYRKSRSGNSDLVLSEVLTNNLKERARELLYHHENVRMVRKSINESFALFEMARIARLSLFASIVSIGVAIAAFWVAYSSYK